MILIIECAAGDNGKTYHKYNAEIYVIFDLIFKKKIGTLQMTIGLLISLFIHAPLQTSAAASILTVPYTKTWVWGTQSMKQKRQRQQKAAHLMNLKRTADRCSFIVHLSKSDSVTTSIREGQIWTGKFDSVNIRVNSVNVKWFWRFISNLFGVLKSILIVYPLSINLCL